MSSVTYTEITAKIKERETEERKTFEENAARAEAKLKLDAESKNKTADEAIKVADAIKKREEYEKSERALREAKEARDRVSDYNEKKEKAAKCYGEVSIECNKAGSDYNEVLQPDQALCAAPQAASQQAGRQAGGFAVGGKGQSCGAPGGCRVCATQLSTDILNGERFHNQKGNWPYPWLGKKNPQLIINNMTPSNLKGTLSPNGRLILD